MNNNSAFLTNEKITKTENDINFTYHDSQFEFLKIHNGFRPGELHMVIAPMGGGKSTLIRTMIYDQLKFKPFI